MPAPDEPIHTQFPDRIVDHAGMRIGSGEFHQDVFVRPDGADAEFPIAASVTANDRDLWKTLGELRHVHRRRFSRKVVAAGQARRAADFEPGMDIDMHIQFRGEPQDRVVIGMTAGYSLDRAAKIFYSNARTVADPFLDLGATFAGKTRVNGRTAGKAVFIPLQNLEDFRVVRIWGK